jgi:hypothetical protein
LPQVDSLIRGHILIGKICTPEMQKSYQQNQTKEIHHESSNMNPQFNTKSNNQFDTSGK